MIVLRDRLSPTLTLSPLQEAAPLLDPKAIPSLIELDDVPKKKLESHYKVPSPEMIAFIDFNVSTTGVLSGVKVRNEPKQLWYIDFSSLVTRGVWCVCPSNKRCCILV